MGTKASTLFKLSSLQVVLTLWRNASTSRTTFFKHQELERYPLSPNMTKIITCLFFPLVSILDGRKGETRVGVVDSVNQLTSKKLLKVFKTSNGAPERIFLQNFLSRFCFKVKNLSVCPLHNVEARKNLAEEAWNYPEFFNGSWSKEQEQHFLPLLWNTQWLHMWKRREDMKIIEKLPCTSGCQNFSFFFSSPIPETR